LKSDYGDITLSDIPVLESDYSQTIDELENENQSLKDQLAEANNKIEELYKRIDRSFLSDREY